MCEEKLLKKRKYHPPKNPRKKKDPVVVTEQQHEVEQQLNDSTSHRKIEDIPTKEPEENEKLNSYTLLHLRVLGDHKSPGLWSLRTLNMQDKMECLNHQNMK